MKKNVSLLVLLMMLQVGLYPAADGSQIGTENVDNQASQEQIPLEDLLTKSLYGPNRTQSPKFQQALIDARNEALGNISDNVTQSKLKNVRFNI